MYTQWCRTWQPADTLSHADTKQQQTLLGTQTHLRSNYCIKKGHGIFCKSKKHGPPAPCLKELGQAGDKLILMCLKLQAQLHLLNNKHSRTVVANKGLMQCAQVTTQGAAQPIACLSSMVIRLLC